MISNILTQDDLLTVFSQITFVNTVLDFKWQFRHEAFRTETRYGWIVWVEFERPDTDTGKIGIGRGRDEIIWGGTTLSGAVKTCWVLVKMIVEHELMEGFRWHGARIFNPHNSVIDLANLSLQKWQQISCNA